MIFPGTCLGVVEMSEASQPGTPSAGVQRESGSARTALPSRPMSGKNRETTPSGAISSARSSVENDGYNPKSAEGNAPSISKDSPGKDEEVSSNGGSPRSTSSVPKVKKLILSGVNAQGQGGQICRLVSVCHVCCCIVNLWLILFIVTATPLALPSGGDPRKGLPFATHVACT